ncbi:hypothetical protein PWT90_07141 [Aphanocladium album]|nr:hypothetical protein PWT90_07141 [Aphanocladium album]
MCPIDDATAEHDDVAIVGMACRVAGDCTSPEALWENLLNQKDASGDMPSMRWQSYLHRDLRNPEALKDTVSRGYFLSSLEDFDASFFGISPMEAEQMDPQQRITLEVVWEALQRAGLTAATLSGSNTGVFWGVNSDDYSRLLLEDLPNIQPWMGIGSAYCGIPNRVSYHFNLMGPSSAIDAACASSLVAVHHAAQAVRMGECDLAIAGGVNALCAPGMFSVLQKAGALSPDGSCRSFDRDVCGYGRGEGAGAIIVKRLSAALRDGNTILALLKGTAVAQDGKTKGIMAPNAEAQAKVALLALKQARLDATQVGFVEAHATSTILGDATELAALERVYGAGRHQTGRSPCLVGSIKPNIGHLEAGAGIMGLIKSVMCVQNGVVPPQANLRTLSSAVDWQTCGLKVVQESTHWEGLHGEPRRAAVCSYGYGGTVSHAIIEEFRRSELTQSNGGALTVCTPRRVILLSGRHQKRIPHLAKALLEYIDATATSLHGPEILGRIASTLATRRDHAEYRAALVVDSLESARASLRSLCNGPSAQVATKWTSQSRVLSATTQKGIVFVFSGHGAQWANMGKSLLRNAAFLDAVSPLDAIVQREIQKSPIQLLRDGHNSSSDITQILTYIMQIGISQVLKSRGIVPSAIIGHSVGEIAATVVAGALTPQQGVLIVTRRSVLYRSALGKGSMIMINKGFEELDGLISDEGDSNLVRAIDVSPSSCVVAGPVESVSNATLRWKKEYPLLKIMKVNTDIAFHSPMLNNLTEPLLETLEGVLQPKLATRCKLYSTSCLDPRDNRLRDSSYWANNTISPVRLRQAVGAAVDDSYRVFVEISSHPIVSHAISEIMLDREIEEWAMIPTLRRDCDAETCIFTAMSELHCIGVDIDWAKSIPEAWLPDLPVEPWLHQPIWRRSGTSFNSKKATALDAAVHDPRTHTLLGKRSYVPRHGIVLYSTTLDSTCKPFPESHPVLGTEIIPAAVLFNTFLSIPGVCSLEDVWLRTVLAIPNGSSRAVQLSVLGNEASIASQLTHAEPRDEDNSWTIHTTTKYKKHQEFSQVETLDISSLKRHNTTRLTEKFSTNYLSTVGVGAMAFPWVVQEHYQGDGSMLCKVHAMPSQAADQAELPWHSSSWAPLMDAATSVGSTIFLKPQLRMPTRVKRIDIPSAEKPPKECWLYIQLRSDTNHICDISILDLQGSLLLKFTEMSFSGIEGDAALQETSGIGDQAVHSLVHNISWVPATLVTKPHWLPSALVVISNQSNFHASWIAPCMAKLAKEPIFLPSCQDLESARLPTEGRVAVVCVPDPITNNEDICGASHSRAWQLLEVIKFACRSKLDVRVFAFTASAHDGVDERALALAPLIGLCRVLASEHPEQFGCLVDGDGYGAVNCSVLIDVMFRVQDVDVVRIEDGLPKVARLQPLATSKKLALNGKRSLLPHAGGTYLITGGLGALGMEVASFLVSHGARRLVLVSRRQLPPRRQWSEIRKNHWAYSALTRIKTLEDAGTTVHAISVDMATPAAARILQSQLEILSLPPVTGVIHAAGVVADQLALETTQDAFARVLAPKINGALALHQLFPPGSIDFMVLFSSCGQLVGFTGQSSYASGNSFLDILATHRQKQENDTTVSFLWTSWRGIGMVADSEYVALELESKGITDVTCDDAFAAWLHTAKYKDINHAVVLRARVHNDNDVPPLPILDQITVGIRRGEGAKSDTHSQNGNAETALPTTAPAMKEFLVDAIQACVANVLHIEQDDVDPKSALTDLGIDSVMMVMLRRRLQQALKTKVPPTLIWSYPTVDSMVNWFSGKLLVTEA